MERADFLDQLVPTSPGHWGGWYVATRPGFSELRLEADLSRAEIAWAVGPSGGSPAWRSGAATGSWRAPWATGSS